MKPIIYKGPDNSFDLSDNLRDAFPPRNPLAPTGKLSVDPASLPVAAFLDRILNIDFPGSPQFKNSRLH